MEKWGINIEVGDCKENIKLGIDEIIAYLATPSKSHSKNPNNAENNPPLNLYEKIWNENGTVNEKNYWALYVYNIIQRIKTNITNKLKKIENVNEADLNTKLKDYQIIEQIKFKMIQEMSKVGNQAYQDLLNHIQKFKESDVNS